MEQSTMRQKANQVIRFIFVQFIAIVGWIIVQSIYSLSPLGRAIPFVLLTVIEGVWWIVFLVIMFLLFRREYNRFVQSAVELEEANQVLKGGANILLSHLKEQHAYQEENPETNI
jgi:hypothetical protein